MQTRPRASRSSAPVKARGSRAGASAGQKSSRGGKSGGQKAPNQSSNTDLPSINGFQFTVENLAAFKEYQQQMEDQTRAAAAARDEGRLF